MDKQKNLFETDHLKTDLKNRTIRGGAITIFSQGVIFFLRMTSTIVLARLLTPDDFGLIAMVTAVTGFVTMFKDMGLSMATIQRDKIDHRQISTLFWFNVLVSIILMLLVCALAPFVALYYEKPRLLRITLALSGIFIFGGLTVQHNALLKRQMHFNKIAFIEIMSLLTGVISAIISAMFGLGYWSLVMMQFWTAGTRTVGVWIATGWRPGLPVRGTGVRSMLAFGGNITGFNIINYFHRNLDHILVGKYCGSSVLGFYSKAYQLAKLPIDNLRAPLDNVALPALSKLQHEPVKFRSYYTKLVIILSFLTMPGMMIIFICSESLILLILGDQWIAMNPLFKVFAVTGFIQPAASTRGMIMISLGQSGRLLRWGIYNSITVVIAFIIGIQWGALGVAIAYTTAVYIILIPSLWYCFKSSPVSIGDFFDAIWKPAISSLVMGTAMFYMYSISGIAMANIAIHVSKILLSSVIGSIVYLLMWIILPGGLKQLRELYGYLLVIFERKNNAWR